MHIRITIRSNAKFNNEKTFSASVNNGCIICKIVDYRGNRIVFKEWLASKAVIHENLLAQRNSSLDRKKFQSRDKPKTSTFVLNAEDLSKPKNLEWPFKDGEHPTRICEKFKSMKVIERLELVQKFALCFNCMRPGHLSKDCKSRTYSVPNGGKLQHILHSDRSMKEVAASVSDATTPVATTITQGSRTPSGEIQTEELRPKPKYPRNV